MLAYVAPCIQLCFSPFFVFFAFFPYILLSTHPSLCYQHVACQLAAMILQRSIRAWLCRLRARRVRKVRHAAFHKAASLIQCKWRNYISKKRHYEATYIRLKARLKQEKLAATLIMEELRVHAQSVSLPPSQFHVRGVVGKRRHALAAGRNL